MTEGLLLVAIVLLLVVVTLLLLLFLRKSAPSSTDPVADRTPELLGQLGAIEKLTTAHMGQIKSDMVSQRDELGNALGRTQQALSQNLGQTLDQHRTALDKVRETLDQRLASFAEALAKSAADHRAEQAAGAQVLARSLQEGTASLAETLGRQQTLVQQSLVDQRKSLTDLQQGLGESQRLLSEALAKTAAEGRVEDRKTSEALSAQLRDRLAEMTSRIDKLAESLKADAEASRKTLEGKMGELQLSNEQRLEQMRQTVDEKLHATLEARLGESFKHVSERLEAVQKGLGEMKVLADGVGDLKKVMTNVKTRGTWGEVQLRALIEDILRPEEFVANYAPRARGERVEFAIRMPGVTTQTEIYLPIDSKFPVEDYQRLVDALDASDVEGARVHGKAMEDRIKACAKDIHDKYLEPGVTTEFGILFLPFEGLYAEVLRRPGLVEYVQRECRVAVCGPTTFGALLNSLRMGFRAVAIQKRSGDIGALLGDVKTEFGKFGVVIKAVGDRLKQAQDELDKVGVRTRAINRKLRDVEVLPEGDAGRLLPLPDGDGVDENV